MAYKPLIRSMVRTAIRRLNQGDPTLLLAMAADDIEFAFPGHNTWATMYRPQQNGRHFRATHIGKDEAAGFAQRFVAHGLQVEIEDILVNGPPWNTRVVIRANDRIPPGNNDHEDAYNNRFVDVLDIRWGRIYRFEVYEDTERTAEWDRQCGRSNSLRL